jgi:hypothetical protein
MRKKEENYLSHITVCGHTLIRYGYFHKDVKLKAASDFKEALLRGEMDHEQLNKIHHGALGQGRLGYIMQLSNTVKKLTFTPPVILGGNPCFKQKSAWQPG